MNRKIISIIPACLFVLCTNCCASNETRQETMDNAETTLPVTWSANDSIQYFDIDYDALLTGEANKYREVSHPTPNYDRNAVNEVKGVILHHTAEPTAEKSLDVLTNSPRNVGTHVVIDYDGTRYIMCAPEVVTYHAGPSILNGRESCNKFTIGIEFQGNTVEAPLTEDQILSAIEYLRPIIAKYHIPMKNIVTHEMVRKAYKAKYPKSKTYGKVDITQAEYKHFMAYFKKEVKAKK